MSENVCVALVFLLVFMALLVALPGLVLGAPFLWLALKIFDWAERNQSLH